MPCVRRYTVRRLHFQLLSIFYFSFFAKRDKTFVPFAFIENTHTLSLSLSLSLFLFISFSTYGSCFCVRFVLRRLNPFHRMSQHALGIQAYFPFSTDREKHKRDERKGMNFLICLFFEKKRGVNCSHSGLLLLAGVAWLPKRSRMSWYLNCILLFCYFVIFTVFVQKLYQSYKCATFFKIFLVVQPLLRSIILLRIRY